MISFRGNYICDLNIMKRQKLDDFTPDTASFVRLHSHKIQDISAISRAVKSWDSQKQIAASIVDGLTHAHFENSYFYPDECIRDYYIATTQKENFDNLIPEKIFGAVEVSKTSPNKLKIEFLEIKPEYSFDNIKRAIKGTGHSIMTILKKMYAQTDISVMPISSAIEFYVKEGFVPDDTRKYYYILKRH